MNQDLTYIIKRPRVTEKASAKTEANVYVFEIASDATKRQVASAIKELYNVTPVKIAVAPIPAKQVMVRNNPGVKKGGKKAYVYLKTGDKIENV